MVDVFIDLALVCVCGAGELGVCVWGGVQVKCTPSVTEAKPLLTENSLSHQATLLILQHPLLARRHITPYIHA